MIFFSPVARFPFLQKLGPFFPLLGFVALAMLFAIASFNVFKQMEKMIIEDKVEDMSSITVLKVAQIVDWRKEQLQRTEILLKKSLLPAEFEKWLRDGMPQAGREKILWQLAEIAYLQGSKNISLFDGQGRAMLTTSLSTWQDADDLAMAMEAIRSRQVAMSDIHRSGEKGDKIMIDMAAPLLVGAANGERVVGAVVFQTDPRDFLYPLVASWPSGSSSAETLLVRQEGNDVLFLNELRHQKGTALTLRKPLSTPRLLAAQAVLGVRSTLDGVDYRGVNVVAAMHQVPGTSWFMVSKIDREEFLAPIFKLRLWSIALNLALALTGSLVVFLWLRAYRMRFSRLKDLHQAALEREMLIKHFEFLTKYANDMILVADDTGCIVEVNERALDEFGYTRDELLSMQVADLRDPVHELSYVSGLLSELMATGELRREENVRRKDGSIFPVEISARVIKVEDKVYLQGILRDITVRRHAEENLRKSEALLKESQKMAHIGNWELDLVNNVLTWSDENYRIFEVDPTRFGASYEVFLEAIHPDDRAMVNKAYTDSVKNRTPYSIVHRLFFSGQPVKHVREWCETYYDQDGKPLRSIGTTQDITEHNMAQLEYQAMLQATTDGFLVVDAHEGRFLDFNIAYSSMSGYSQEELKYMGIADVEVYESAEQTSQHNEAIGEHGRVFETSHRRKDGVLINVEISAYYLDIRGGIFIVYIRDITERKLAERKINRLNNLYSAISRANEAMVRIKDRYLLLDEICHIAVESGQFKLAWIGLVDDATHAIKVAAASGEAEAYLNGIQIFIDADKPEGRGPSGMAIRENKVCIIDDYFNDTCTQPWQEKAREHGLRSCASCPLSSQGRTVGALTVYADEANFFDEELTNLLVDLATDISLSLDNFTREDQRRVAEEILRQSEDKFRTLVSNLPQKVFVKDVNSVYTACNTLYAADFGITQEEIVGKTDYNFYPRELAEKYIADDRRIIDSGKMQSFEEKYLLNEQEYFVHTTKAPLRDAQGGVMGVIGVFWDITDIKRAEKKLLESEQRFRDMADNAPIIIWMASTSKGQMYTGCGFFNKQWHDFTGLTLEESQGYDWVTIVHPDDREHCLEVYIGAFEATRAFMHEYRLQRKDGAYRWIRDSGVPRFTADGEFMGFIGTCIDITEQMLVDEMRAEVEHAGRINIAGEMAAGLAHELSQPLTAAGNYLDGCLQRMEKGEWDREKLHKAIKLAHRQTERAGSIINHLKALIRKRGAEHSLMNINELIQDSIDFLALDISHQSIRVIPHFSDLPPVRASRVEIEQVLLNLIKNAIDSMESLQRRELRLSTRVVESGNILVTVSDTGKGIPLADLDQVFNPFKTSKQNGLGLGLAICRSLVENHGGRIWAEQSDTVGTRFNFTLPTELI